MLLLLNTITYRYLTMVKNVNISLMNLKLPTAITIRWKFDSMIVYTKL